MNGDNSFYKCYCRGYSGRHKIRDQGRVLFLRCETIEDI